MGNNINNNSELKRKISYLEEQNEILLKENNELKEKLISIQKNINSIIKEAQQQVAFEKEKTLNSFKLQTELQAKVSEWEKIIDEMAHSVNSDVFVAVNYLSALPFNSKIQIANYHIKQIRDLINLTMWYLKRKELPISGDIKEVSIADIIKKQIELIKDSISTLRISSDEHQENLINMDVNYNLETEGKIRISTEFSDAIILIVKDLLRNAFKNTKEENPVVSIFLFEENDFIIIRIENNIPISQKFADWINMDTLDEPEISKSSKVGLRIIKKWIPILKIKIKLIPDLEKNITTTLLTIPKYIIYNGKD